MSQFLELNLAGYSSNEDLNSIFPRQVLCVCCLSKKSPFVNLLTCKHSSFLECFFKFKVDLADVIVCLQCHTVMKRIEDFKQQVEKNVKIFNEQRIELKTETPKLQISSAVLTNIDPQFEGFIKETGVIDKLDVEGIKEETYFYEADVKIERDFSDIDTPLAEIKRQSEEHSIKKKVKRKKIKRKEISQSLAKYEGKILTVTLSKEALMEERESQKRDQKYLRLPYKCEDCIVSFEFEMALRSHMEKQHDENKNGHTCEVCKSVLSSTSSYKEHSRRHLKRYECSSCGKRYHDEYSAVQHYNELHGVAGSISLQFSCQDCDFVTHSHRSYRYHRSKHRQEKNACEICGNLFVSASNLKIHMYTVHKQSTRVFQCEPCGKVYKGKSGLFAHMTTTHGTTDRRAYCADCCTYFRTQQNLVHHLRTHSNHVEASDNRFVCDLCDSRFISKSNLKSHIEWEHLGIRKYRCTKCSKAFRQNTSLKKHIQYVHEKKRPPRDKICDYCGHGFTTQAILSSHIRTHTGERPHRCNHCGATFAHSSALYNHNKLLHNPHRIK